MKKSFSFFKGVAFNKLGFLPILMTFLVFAAMQTDLRAQSSTLPSQSQQNVPPARALYQIPSGPFVTSLVALDRLEAALKTIKEQQLNQFVVGSPAYNAAHRRYVYYSQIRTNIEGGKGVAESIVDALGSITLSDAPPALATLEEAVIEKNAAIVLLS